MERCGVEPIGPQAPSLSLTALSTAGAGSARAAAKLLLTARSAPARLRGLLLLGDLQ